jgi:uncharacterized membrane protein
MREADTTRAAEAAPAGQATESDPKDEGGAERLVFFSDAVVAIAITLLALDLRVPEGATSAEFWHDMGRHFDDYLGFLISFVVIATHWFSHHRMFGYVTRVSGRLNQWNMLWLLTIVLTPFATKVIVGDHAFPARFGLYALVQALASVFFGLSVYEMHRSNLVRPGTSHSVFTRSYLRSAILVVTFLVSIPVALATHWAYLCWFAAPLSWRVQELLHERRARAMPAPPGTAG